MAKAGKIKMPKYKKVPSLTRKAKIRAKALAARALAAQFLRFEAMITHYGSPNDEIIYKGKEEVIIAYVDKDVSRYMLRKHGLGHLRAGGVYLAVNSERHKAPKDAWCHDFDNTLRKGWVRRAVKDLQWLWNMNPMGRHLPFFLQEENEDARVLLKPL